MSRRAHTPSEEDRGALHTSAPPSLLDDKGRVRGDADAGCARYRTQLKMQEYLDVFARFKRDEHVQAVANVLEGHSELDKFEKSQLGMAHPVLLHACD